MFLPGRMTGPPQRGAGADTGAGQWAKVKGGRSAAPPRPVVRSGAGMCSPGVLGQAKRDTAFPQGDKRQRGPDRPSAAPAAGDHLNLPISGDRNPGHKSFPGTGIPGHEGCGCEKIERRGGPVIRPGSKTPEAPPPGLHHSHPSSPPLPYPPDRPIPCVWPWSAVSSPQELFHTVKL